MSTLSLNVISWNVGGSGDTQRLMKLAGQAGEIDRFRAAPWYDQRITDAFQDGELYGIEADILCLQELYRNDLEKQVLVEKIKAAGFTILGDGDLAIAYKTAKFEDTGKSGVTSRDFPAFYACLKEKTSGKEICVVSNHAKGFDARIAKTVYPGTEATTGDKSPRKFSFRSSA